MVLYDLVLASVLYGLVLASFVLRYMQCGPAMLCDDHTQTGEHYFLWYHRKNTKHLPAFGK